jgi:serine O-acetyltransferase
MNLILFSSEIQPGAVIGEGCLFMSACGIMINSHAVIGRNCLFVHQLSLAIGPRLGIDIVNDRIVLGDDVVVSAGVRIIGNLVIGDRCHIGPNKVIRQSLPADTIVE